MNDFLFARPSFLGGAARVLDLFGTLQEYNRSHTPEIADQRAMFSDLRAIGVDFKQVLERSEAAISGGTLGKRRSGRKTAPSRAGSPPVATKVEQHSFSYQGPLPPAAELERIEHIAPGSFSTLVQMVVDQAAHRQDLEKRVIENDIWLSRIGLACAFVLQIRQRIGIAQRPCSVFKQTLFA